MRADLDLQIDLLAEYEVAHREEAARRGVDGAELDQLERRVAVGELIKEMQLRAESGCAIEDNGQGQQIWASGPLGQYPRI
jgi:hypothetical protein